MLRAHLDITVVAYLNNILIFSRNKQEHVEHVKEVLQYLNLADLQLKLEKCKFYKDKVEFLGFTVEVYRVKISKSKILVVKT
jgi:hypothetical protein